MNEEKLVEMAFKARKFSYSPYSNFQVGAALLAKNGKIYQGCNIESASYTPTNCGERTAIFKAVSEGVKEFTAIVIVGGPADALDIDYCFPCGVCRQVMAEFCEDDFKILLANSQNQTKVYTLNEILPNRFGPKNLQGE